MSNCPICGATQNSVTGEYPYLESGLDNVVLEGVTFLDCPGCGQQEVVLPRLARIHEAIARALTNSPGRLSGQQLRFLRLHLGLTGDQLGSYLHADRTEISRCECGEDPIGPAMDRLLRLLAAALDPELHAAASRIAEHLPSISDENGQNWDLHIDAATLTWTFVRNPVAA